MVALCRIELFGGVRIIRGDSTISRFRSQKTAALLAFLAYHRDRAHPREALIDMLWPWASPVDGRRSLSVALSSLRHQLEPPEVSAGAVLVADRASVQLNPETATTDVAEFEAALQEARRAADKTTKEEQLEEAVRLYRGEFLSGLYEPWIPAEQLRVSELYVGAVVELATLLAERGETAGAASHLHRAIEAEPLREEPYRYLIRLNAQRGEPGAALATYHELERVLAEELGEKPSAATRQLVKEMEHLAARTPSRDLRSPSLEPRRPARRRRRAKLPTGVVTILLVGTDRESSGDPGVGPSLREEFRRHGGVEIDSERSAFAAAFPHAGDALNCAATCQLRVLGQGTTDREPPTRLAMAIHTADLAVGSAGQYPVGSLHRVERLLGAAHFGQILCSEASAGLTRYDLNGGLQLRDLGVYRLRGASATERIFQLDYPSGPDMTPPSDAETGHSGHLPYQITRFFGRRQEIEKVQAMLAGDARLVTLIGSPGCGKTRLSIEVARQLVETFKGNVWFVPLADLREGSDILDRALDPLGIRRSPQAAPLDQIASALAEQPALIVFDNFEHLIDSAGEVRNLLERLPDLCCLVTSRQRLRLAGEREFPVTPLLVPDQVSVSELLSNDSARLFVDRAQMVKPDFQLTARNADTVAALCQRLEGVPLAIELAAARSHTHAMRRILEHVTKGEDLATRSRDVEERHRSLRAAVDWSCSLLSPELLRFFARLSVFRGGWTEAAAEAVCDESMASDYLADLQDRSLVVVHPDSCPLRFRMLELVRTCARGLLVESGDLEQAHSRHLDFYQCAAEDFERATLRGPSQTLLQQASLELANFLEAASWAETAPATADRGLSLVLSLHVFWHCHNPRSGRSTIQRMLRNPMISAELRARALNVAGALAQYVGDYKPARALFEEALSMARAIACQHKEETCPCKRRILGVLNNLSIASRFLGDFGVAESCIAEVLTAYRQRSDFTSRMRVGHCLQHLAQVRLAQGRIQTACSLFAESIEVYRELGIGAHGVLVHLGESRWAAGDAEAATAALEEGLTGAVDEGDRLYAAYARLWLARLSIANGELAAARLLLQESLCVIREFDDLDCVQLALDLSAELMLAFQSMSDVDPQPFLARAALLLGAAEGTLQGSGQVLAVHRKNKFDDLRQQLSTALDAQSLEEFFLEGHAMRSDQAITYALDCLERC